MRIGATVYPHPPPSPHPIMPYLSHHQRPIAIFYDEHVSAIRPRPALPIRWVDEALCTYPQDKPSGQTNRPNQIEKSSASWPDGVANSVIITN